jgi:hypothetical protein
MCRPVYRQHVLANRLRRYNALKVLLFVLAIVRALVLLCRSRDVSTAFGICAENLSCNHIERVEILKEAVVRHSTNHYTHPWSAAFPVVGCVSGPRSP